MSGRGKYAMVAAVLTTLAGFFSIFLISPELSRGIYFTTGAAARMAYATTVVLLGASPKANAFVTTGSLARTYLVSGGRVQVGPSMTFRRLRGTSARTSPSSPNSLATHLRSLTGSSAMLMSGISTTEGPSAKQVLVPVADGSEEIESVTIIDTLVRAGASVTVASVGEEKQVTCSRGVKLVADCKIADCGEHEWDAVVIPGGMPGATHLKDNTKLEEIIKKQNSEGRIVAAICAAPAVVLASHGILDGKKATCYPAAGFATKIPERVNDKVVVDGNVITSQGPATAMPFALQLVESLFGAAKAEEVGKGMLAV